MEDWKYNKIANTFEFNIDGVKLMAHPVGETVRKGVNNPTIYELRSPDGYVLGWFREGPLTSAAYQFVANGKISQICEQFDFRNKRAEMVLV